MGSEDSEIDWKGRFKALQKWTLRNWFTVVGIIIILLIVNYDLTHCQKGKMVLVKSCNEYWFEEIKYKCPQLLESKFVGDNDSLKTYLDISTEN